MYSYTTHTILRFYVICTTRVLTILHFVTHNNVCTRSVFEGLNDRTFGDNSIILFYYPKRTLTFKFYEFYFTL